MNNNGGHRASTDADVILADEPTGNPDAAAAMIWQFSPNFALLATKHCDGHPRPGTRRPPMRLSPQKRRMVEVLRVVMQEEGSLTLPPLAPLSHPSARVAPLRGCRSRRGRRAGMASASKAVGWGGW